MVALAELCYIYGHTQPGLGVCLYKYPHSTWLAMFAPARRMSEQRWQRTLEEELKRLQSFTLYIPALCNGIEKSGSLPPLLGSPVGTLI